jgi:hypothetical protein
LEKVADYPLYTMIYKGEYASPLDLPSIERVQRQENLVNTQALSQPWACSLFAALGDPQLPLFGRNFDWDFSPAVLLFTDPPHGYASLSMVDIEFLGFDLMQVGNLLDLPIEERLPLLSAPSWPFDGMNENGLAIGMAAVPSGFVPDDPQKQTIGSIEVIRQVLDNAADIDQAIEIISSFNIDFTGGPGLHYLIADSSGKSVLVEFYDGQVRFIPADQPWLQATNFLVSSVDNPQGQCGRYKTMANALEQSAGRLSPENALHLLDSVSQISTQWSVLYHLNTGEVEVIMGNDFDSSYQFRLK